MLYSDETAVDPTLNAVQAGGTVSPATPGTGEPAARTSAAKAGAAAEDPASAGKVAALLGAAPVGSSGTPEAGAPAPALKDLTVKPGPAAASNAIFCCGTCGYVNCPSRILDLPSSTILSASGQLPGYGSSAPMGAVTTLPGGAETAATGPTKTQIATLSGPITSAVAPTKTATTNTLSPTSLTATTTATASTTNKIVLENQKVGNPVSEWGINGSGDDNIEGFATDISTNVGKTVNFKIDTNSNNYRIDIYRLGYYGGLGARKIDTIQHTGVQTQPTPLRDAATGMVDAGNWSVSASWNVPTDAVSGVYIAKLTRQDGTAGQNEIPFIVRDDASTSDIIFQTSDETWQAYNPWGGANFYGGNGPATGQGAGRAYAVSYNRPITTRGGGLAAGPQDYIYGAEFPAIMWLEQNGYDVSYMSGVDADRNGG